MKISNEKFAELKTAITEMLAGLPNIVEAYENGKFPRSDRTKDLQMRFNWDCLFAVSLKNPQLVPSLYNDGLNDDHISTALNKICPKVVRRY